MFEDVLRELHKLERGVKIPIKIELDDNGYFDRRCPSDECGVHFKVMFNDWRDIVRDEIVYCPLCRHDAESSEWNTPEQVEYIKNAATIHVHKRLGRAFQSDARRFNSRQNRNSFIQMNMSYRPGRIPRIPMTKATDVMTQEFRCDECNCRYSSIGAAFFCPSCGHNSVLDTFANSLETVKKTIDSIPIIRQALIDSSDENIAEDSIRHIYENGLVKVVCSFERYAEACFHKLPNSNRFKLRSNQFQRLMESDSLWKNATSTGYSAILDAAEYQALNRYFQQRHLLAHREGIVDQKYIDRANDHRFDAGQRLIVTEESVCELVAIVEKLSNGIVILTTSD